MNNKKLCEAAGKMFFYKVKISLFNLETPVFIKLTLRYDIRRILHQTNVLFQFPPKTYSGI